MSNVMIGLFFGIGLGGFVYAKMMHQSGGNVKSSIIVALSVGIVGFFVIFSIFKFFLSGS